VKCFWSNGVAWAVRGLNNREVGSPALVAFTQGPLSIRQRIVISLESVKTMIPFNIVIRSRNQ
jgi:hypothetical protein